MNMKMNLKMRIAGNHPGTNTNMGGGLAFPYPTFYIVSALTEKAQVGTEKHIHTKYKG